MSEITLRPPKNDYSSYLYFIAAAVIPVVALMQEGFASFIGSLFLSAAIAFVGLRDIGRASDRRPRFIADQEGVYAPGFFEKKLPWAAISNMMILRWAKGGPFLDFDVANGDQYGRVDSYSMRTALDEPGETRQRFAFGDYIAVSEFQSALERVAPKGKVEPASLLSKLAG
jgi:hypothetical protein